jgi:hypothetical protein
MCSLNNGGRENSSNYTGCGLIAHHFDLLYPFKVLNIPRNDPILAKRNFAIAPISLRFRSAMKDVSRQTKEITSILGSYACFPQPG